VPDAVRPGDKFDGINRQWSISSTIAGVFLIEAAMNNGEAHLMTQRRIRFGAMIANLIAIAGFIVLTTAAVVSVMWHAHRGSSVTAPRPAAKPSLPQGLPAGRSHETATG
jgi:hypothetical protein